MSAREALERLERAELPPCPAPPKSEERRFRLAEAKPAACACTRSIPPAS